MKQSKSIIISVALGVLTATSVIAQQITDFSYWVPYVDTNHRGANVTSNLLDFYAFDDGTNIRIGTNSFSMNSGEFRRIQPPELKEGLHITSNKPLQITYSFYIGHFGLYEDGALGYSLIEEKQLGSEYWVPTPNTLISMLATNNNTTVNVNGVEYKLNIGETKRINSVKVGTRLISDKPIAIVAVNFTNDHYGATYAYEIYPVNKLGTTYFSPHQHSFSHSAAIDSSRVYVLAPLDGTIVTVNNKTFELKNGESVTYLSSGEINVVSNNPIYTIYLSDVYARDPWASVFRHYCYALSLLPSSLGITDAILSPSGSRSGHGFPSIEVSIISFEDNNRITLFTDGVVRKTQVLKKGERVYYHEGEIAEWERNKLDIKAEAPIQVTSTLRGWWNGISEATWGNIVLGRRIDEFQVSAIFPNKGGNTGRVSTFIHGSGFKEGTIAKLVRTGEVILAEVGLVTGRFINATFDLSGHAQGLWDIEITNPNSISKSLISGFTIEEGRDAQIWVDIIGRNTIRAGRAQQFTVIYGNRGNIDAIGAYIWITGIPKRADMKVNFDYLDIPPPDGMGESQVFFETDKEKIIPLFILTIPPGITRALNIELVIPDAINFELKAYMVTP